MFHKKAKWVVTIFIISLIGANISPVLAAGTPLSPQEAQVVQEVESLMPLSIQMVDEAINVLTPGWNAMPAEQQERFRQIFDPGDSGQVDEVFIRQVLENYRRLRRRLDGRLVVAYETDSQMCNLMRIYYTDLFKLYVCPYFNEEADAHRKARVLIHEVAHMALLATDRPYYDPKSYSTRYNALTPRGSWTHQIPLLGRLFGEFSRNDTLYHPDAYSWFAALQLAENS